MTITHEQFRAALRHPCRDSWSVILRYGEQCRRESRLDREAFVAWCQVGLKRWPQEFSRPTPTRWPTEMRVIEYKILEVHTYGIYVTRICGDARLRCRDGSQAVRLQARPDHYGRNMAGEVRKLEEDGKLDLDGGMVLESPEGRRLEVIVELDVKMYTGREEEDQIKRVAAIRGRGGVAGFVYTVEEAVQYLKSEKSRLERMLV